MIDYRAHAFALDSVRQALAAATFADPGLDAARDQTLADVSGAEDHALLGAFVDHLLAHAASDGTELTLLEHAAELWQEGVDLYGALGDVRTQLEGALETPADPTSAARFNQAAIDAQRFAQRLHALRPRIVALQGEIDSLPHLPPHPRQEDVRVDSWDWGNFLLARRTDALVRALTSHASDATTRAFAFGALASYGANVSGSAYLGHVVGGPRRAHRYRDRIARNSIGSWLKREHASIPSLTDMAQRIGFANPASATLPPDIAALIEQAVSATFDPARTPPLPDLALGYRRLVTHLGLLDRFTAPPAPAMPSAHFTGQLFADPANPPPSLRPQAVGVTGDTGGGVSIGSNSPGSSQVGNDDSKSTSGNLCVAVVALIVLFVILLVVALISCIIEWADGNECSFFEELGDRIKDLFEEEPPHPTDPPTTRDPEMNGQGLTAFASTEQAAQLVAHLWDVHQQMWEGLNQAYEYLAKTGFIYPDALLEIPGYKQFVSTPPVASNKWPHRPEPDPDASYHLYPTSNLESPVQAPSPFPPGSSPDAFAVESNEQSPTAARIALPLWRQMAAGEQDSTNYDMDADRGHHHPCWTAGGSIDDEPVDVAVLSYEEQ